MRSRAIVVAAVLTSALVSGGWLMEKKGVPRAPLGSDRRERSCSTRCSDTCAATTWTRFRIRSSIGRPWPACCGQLHDPHTVYLDSRRLSRLDESTSGHYAGVGIQMDVRDSGITVVATLRGTPAEQAGILSGDRIIEIDGKSTLGLTADEALKTLRGPAGSERARRGGAVTADRRRFSSRSRGATSR